MGHKVEPAIHDASVAGVVKGEYILGLRFLSDLIEGRQYVACRSLRIVESVQLDRSKEPFASLLQEGGGEDVFAFY